MKNYETYFIGNEERMAKLELLHEKKVLLKENLNYNTLTDSYVVEICGLPRTGKTNTTQRLFSFFKKGNIDTKVADEPAYLVKNSTSNTKLKQMSKLDFNDRTLELSKKNLNKLKENKPSIILMDRGIIDNYFWYQMMYQDNIIDKFTYEDKMESLYFDLSKVDKIYLFMAKPDVIIKRDYLNEIYIEDREKTTPEGVKKLSKGYESLFPIIKYMKGNIEIYDTTNCDEIDVAMDISNSIINELNKKLILK